MNRSSKIWVTNMCQKLEDICTDIDKLVCKEPVSFVGKQMETVGKQMEKQMETVGNQMETVGNQMETVGANVKNFFSGIVDDFGLTRVVDPVHEAQVVPSKGINLAETSTNSVAEVKENTVDSNTNNPKEAPLTHEEFCHEQSSTGLPHSEQIISEISQHLIGETDSLPINETLDNTTQVNRDSSSTNSQNLDNRFEEEVVYDESSHSDALAFEYSDWGLENIIDLNLETDDIIEVIEGDQLMNLEEKKTLLNSPIDELECDFNTLTTHESSEPESSVTCNENQEENSKHNISCGLSSESLCESLNSSFGNFIVEPDTIDCKPMETMDYLSVSSDILSSCGSFSTVDYDTNNDTYASCSGTGLTDFSTVDFEDVQYDKFESGAVYEKLSLFPNTSRSKSYKKMIKDAFMSRKRITKEYKQLAIRYADIDTELCQPTQSSKPPVQDLRDSEWELL